MGKEEDYYPPPAPPRKYNKKVQKIKDRMAKEREGKTLLERMMGDGTI